MGGYGLYVWLVYGAALLIIMINIILPSLSHRRIITQLKRRKN